MGDWNLPPSPRYDFVQDTDPADADIGDKLYRTDTNEVKVYDGANWHLFTVTDFDELTGSARDDQLAGYPWGTGDLGFNAATEEDTTIAISGFAPGLFG